MLVVWKMQKREVLLTFADAVGVACTEFLSSLWIFEDTSLCDSPEGGHVCVSVLALMQYLCSCSRCLKPVPALETCWTLRQKAKAARLGLGSQASTWARQWRHLSRRSSLSHGRCTCAGKESMELGIEEGKRASFAKCLTHCLTLNTEFYWMQRPNSVRLWSPGAELALGPTHLHQVFMAGKKYLPM